MQPTCACIAVRIGICSTNECEYSIAFLPPCDHKPLDTNFYLDKHVNTIQHGGAC